MAKDELFDVFKTKQESMELLTSYVTSMAKPLVPDYLEKYLNGIHIYWIQIKPKLEIIEKLNNDARTAAPDLMDSYLESPAVKNSSKDVYENVKIFYDFPKELDLLKDFYFFAIFTLCSHDGKQLSKGYFSDLGKNYFKEGAFYTLLNTNALTAMYVSHYLHSRGFPADTLFTALSAEQYEKSDSHTQIVFSDCSKPCDLILQFEEKYKLCEENEENLRILRKLMEIAKNPATEKSDLALMAVKDEKDIWSIIGTTKATKSTPAAKFEGRLNWTFVEDEKEKFQFYKGRYILNWGDNKLVYEKEVKKVDPQYQRIVKDLVGILKNQKHGTAAIIADRKPLSAEIERLCGMNKGIRIKEFDFLDSGTNKDYMNQIGMTNIDGAVFIDIKGTCHAIGMIVDGKTVIKGDAGRGARYNSIKNYVNWAHKTGRGYFVGIIISEDGMKNVVTPEST